MDEIAGLERDTLERARLSRDPRFDGKFFIAVITTGVYCRPVCPSPTSNVANVRYYATAAAAAEAGFRPCLRCRPEAAPGTSAWLGTSALVRRALRLIQESFLDTSSVDALAERLGVGPRHLHRLFVRHVGTSPLAVARTCRLRFAKRLLDDTDLRVTEIALAAGFGSLRRFNDAFRRTYGRAPGEMRRRRRGGLDSEAREEVVLKLAYRPPYDWPQMLECLETHAVTGVERVDAQSYSRTLAVGDDAALIRVRALERERVLELRVHAAAPEALFQISSTARRVFDLAADPARIATAFERDPLLAPLVRQRPGLRIPGVWDPFECAVRSVLGQQVSIAEARLRTARLVVRAGRAIPGGSNGLTHLFPSPEALATADLDGLGLTPGQQVALGALARAVSHGALDFAAPSEEITEALAGLPGVGAWTAACVALRALGEPDAFPACDLLLRRTAGGGGALPTPYDLLARAEAWRPWRGYAALHLWLAASEALGGDRSSRVRKRPASAKRPAYLRQLAGSYLSEA